MSVRWQVLDDGSFVMLIAELLRRIGFVDLMVGGSVGSDGGIDLVATELINSALQAPRPVRWGVQCKFSKNGRRTALRDHEIGDIVGVIKSDRNKVHQLGGFLLVTNQRVSHTLVERFRGLDRSSGYRVECISGEQLEGYLQENPSILGPYFGRVIEEIESLVKESTVERAQEVTEVSRWRPTDLGDDENDLTGQFICDTGILVLQHDGTLVEGQYQYNSDEYVARLEGIIENGVLSYDFQWYRQATRGKGFYIVSPDGCQLDGLWLLGDELDELSFGEVRRKGQRKTYRRIT